MERIVAAVDKGDLDILYSSQVAFVPSSRVVRVGLLLPDWIGIGSPLFFGTSFTILIGSSIAPCINCGKLRA
jgi:hypothetical protein